MGKIGMLSVIKEYRKNGRVFCECLCDCGSIKEIRKDHIGNGKTISCGCFGREQRLKSCTKHGMIRTRIYTIWLDMKQRCGNPKNTGYLYYGEKGVSVCAEWLNDFKAFMLWAYSCGYNDYLTIDRIDSNGNYEPCNCRWISQSENTKLAHLGKKYKRRSLTYGKRS